MVPTNSDSDWPTRSHLSSPNRRKKKPRRRRRWLLKGVLALFILGLVVGLAGLGVVWFYVQPRIELAETFDLTEIDDLEVASVILDRQGEEIGRIFVQNREPIPVADVSPNFTRALLAAEDARFYVHDGVDYIGILRAVWLNLRAGEVTQGASTITQQLARNAFELKERSLSRKVTEAFLARRIEREIDDKDEILELYLNRIYFGSGFYGISAAAKGYFGKEAKDLTVPESALLAGVIRNPYYRSPYNFPEASKNTRNYVLQRMYAEDMITKEELKEYQASSVITAPRTSAFGQSKYVYERVRQQVIELIGYERASEGGFVIHTTIDNQVQLAAEEALTRQLDKIETNPGYANQTRDVYKAVKSNFLETAPEGSNPPPPEYLQGSALMIDNQTGGIIALVGGRDFNDSMFDRTIQARRPPGTAFTPFVFAAAFEAGAFPGTRILDSEMDNKQVQIGGETGILGEWGTERESVYEGEITARRALSLSRNAATVRMGTQKTSLQNVVAIASRAGIRFDGEIKNFNATLLGKSETSMEELCRAYTVFPNQGHHPNAIFIISSIDDAAGETIFRPKADNNSIAAIDPFTAHQVTSILSEALDTGSARKAREKYGLGDFPVAGKTGTEYGFTDNWFVGYTSEVTCAVWAGFDQPQTIFPGAFSSDTVLPVWTAMMNQAAETFPPRGFPPPEGAVKVEICRESGQLATDACYEVEPDGSTTKQVRSTYVEYLRPGTEVRIVCEDHGAPGAQPRSKPSLGPDPLLTLSDGGGGFRAMPVVSSDPIIPLGPTVVGTDPYQSLAPVIRAQQVVIPEPEPEPEPIIARPIDGEDQADIGEGRPESGDRFFRELSSIGTDPEASAGDLSTQEPLRAVPTPPPTPVIARPLTLDGENEPPARVTLPPPPPIEFD